METGILNDRNELKNIFREVLEEFYEKKKDILKYEISDIIEEAGMANAIEEGEKTELIDENTIFKTIEGK